MAGAAAVGSWFGAAAARRAHPTAATQGQAAIIWELDRARAMLAAGAALEEVLRPAGPADFQPPMKAAEVRRAGLR